MYVNSRPFSRGILAVSSLPEFELHLARERADNPECDVVCREALIHVERLV